MLESFLVEIKAKIFRFHDQNSGGWLVDRLLDQAWQKGTGRWRVQVVLDLVVPVPSSDTAIEARVLSSFKE